MMSGTDQRFAETTAYWVPSSPWQLWSVFCFVSFQGVKSHGKEPGFERVCKSNKRLNRSLKTLEKGSDVNKDWTCKDKDKDQAYKDQDKD